MDFEGRPVFLVDVSAFPGMSGSPVLAVANGLYEAEDGSMRSGRIWKLLGIFSAMPVVRERRPVDAAGFSTEAQTIETSLQLGYVWKAGLIADLAKSYRARHNLGLSDLVDNPSARRRHRRGAMVEEVYTELRRIAERYVRREQAQSVQATDLVHEAYLRLAKEKRRSGRTARTSSRSRRFRCGGCWSSGRARAARPSAAAPRSRSRSTNGSSSTTARRTRSIVIALDRALTRLAELDPQQARIVELRFFGGLSVEEAAEALSISPATLKRHWTIAKAWLLRELEGAGGAVSAPDRRSIPRRGGG